MDGVDFEIQEPFPFKKDYSEKWFSHKFKGPGLRYEILLCIQTGDIVSVSGPFPCGSWPDLEIFKLKTPELDAGERVEADRGYSGLDPYITKTPSTPYVINSRSEYTDMQNTVRARQETVNKRFKQWACMRKVFRHCASKHSYVLRSVATITQICIEMGEPLFEVKYKT